MFIYFLMMSIQISFMVLKEILNTTSNHINRIQHYIIIYLKNTINLIKDMINTSILNKINQQERKILVKIMYKYQNNNKLGNII